MKLLAIFTFLLYITPAVFHPLDVETLEDEVEDEECVEKWIGNGECDEENDFDDLSCGPRDGGDCGPIEKWFGDGECDEVNNWKKWENYPNGPWKLSDPRDLETDEYGVPFDDLKLYDGGDCTCDSSEPHKELLSRESFPEKLKIVLKNDVKDEWSEIEGKYTLKLVKVSGKPIWVDEDEDNAIWYDDDDNTWNLGSVSNVDTSTVALLSEEANEDTLPHEISWKWK